MHRRARLFWQEGRSTDPVDRPESFALWNGPGRPTGRPDREQCSLYPGHGRPTGRPGGRPTAQFWPITASFWSPINWAIWGLFYIRFEEEFWASFSYSFQWLYPQVLEPIFPNQKGVYQECFKRDFLEFFLHHFNPCFLTQHLSHPLLYLPIGIFVVRGF